MPPFVGVAVNVTLVPEHIELPGLAAMVTDGIAPVLLTASLKPLLYWELFT